ncbi:alpha/beta hydrolase family protein [Pengzhenrongella sp.]|uniref:alpha/beta hydrolase family protein n=1 Tax=Pengzhenrongella sp. TaxID=2888820 RepID=UPI002F95155D
MRLARPSSPGRRRRPGRLSRPGVPALLLHGRADSLVPVKFTTEFAAALRSGGHQVTVDLVRGVDHSGIYRTDVAAHRLIDWINALP